MTDKPADPIVFGPPITDYRPTPAAPRPPAPTTRGSRYRLRRLIRARAQQTPPNSYSE